MAERILMIDDDAISRKLATHILEGKYLSLIHISEPTRPY